MKIETEDLKYYVIDRLVITDKHEYEYKEGFK